MNTETPRRTQHRDVQGSIPEAHWTVCEACHGTGWRDGVVWSSICDSTCGGSGERLVWGPAPEGAR